MDKKFLQGIHQQINEVIDAGLYKPERVITSPQSGVIKIETGDEVINLCSNNYLGLSNHPDVVKAAHDGLDTHGFGMSSVRFICGTQDIHKQLEKQISQFLGTEDTILYPSCFDANGGLFETLLAKEDAVISDELNHASIIDGIRLCKAMRFRYKNNDMNDLEEKLKEAKDARRRIIATDGVFSMDGIIANLSDICALADKYQALVMIDDCHSVGFMGENGKGTHEFCNVMGKVDIITGTLGKALGGATGGYTSGRKEIIEWLRQKSRPYLFSNAAAPSVVTASIKVLDMMKTKPELRKTLWENTHYFKQNISKLGFDIVDTNHPIIPMMLKDAKLAQTFAEEMLSHGVYVIGFSYPVVPKDKARIRTQVSAALNKEHLDKALAAFEAVGKKLGVISKATIG